MENISCFYWNAFSWSREKEIKRKWFSLKYAFMVLLKQNVCDGKQGFCCQDGQNEG